MAKTKLNTSTKRTVWGVIQNKKGEYLLLKRSSKVNNPNLWNLPGGNVEQEETPGQALANEVLEEIGIIITPGDIYQESQITLPSKICHFFQVKNVKPKRVKLNEESSAQAWVSLEKVLKRNLHLPTKIYFQQLSAKNKQEKVGKVSGLKAKIKSLAQAFAE